MSVRQSAKLAGVTADTALRPARALNTTPDFWLNLQAHYELTEAQRGSRAYEQIRPLVAEPAG